MRVVPAGSVLISAVVGGLLHGVDLRCWRRQKHFVFLPAPAFSRSCHEQHSRLSLRKFRNERNIVNISFLQEETINSMIAEKLAVFRQLTNEIHEINKSEPLAQEFDEIIANRVNVLSLFDWTCER